LPSEVLA
jgi:hypothetical protein